MSADEMCLCARCAQNGKTCCQTAQVFITKRDRERIQTITGRDDFFEFVPPADGDYLPAPELDPLWARIFAPDGSRWVLRHDARGDCHFLGDQGCRLGMEERPWVCRLYPFDYSDRCLKGVYGHLCPAPEGENGPLLLALLGMNRDDAERWRVELYDAIRDEFGE